MGAIYSQLGLKSDTPSSNSKTEDLPQLKTKFGRNAHLLRFWDELCEEDRRSLVQQFEALDVDNTEKNFEMSSHFRELSTLEGIDDDHYAVANRLEPEVRESYWHEGLKAIAEGKVAVIVLAGGQATRLGASCPKGTLSLGLQMKSGTDSLLALQAARIARLQELAKKEFPGSKAFIHWMVMTSQSTEKDTTEHLKKVVQEIGIPMPTLFSQREIPCFALDGKLILASKAKIATAPDGNGGLYAALRGHLKALISSGVLYVHVYCVDNILCRVADPHFIGYCIAKGSDCAAKAVEKTEPNEAVGVICRESGKVRVVEYSEIPKELSEKRDEKGRLVLRAGNIANHFFTIDFLERVCSEECHLTYHRALKKIPYVDENGTLVKPVEPNGIKLEQFVFDVFEYSKNFFVWEVSREEEFSPLKNAESAKKDCLSTCRRDMSQQHRRWLEMAGAHLASADTFVFVHPKKSYLGEGLEEYKDKNMLDPCVLC